MLDKKYKVNLGGLLQKIHVKGDIEKPMILFLHGGPGVSNRHSVTKYNQDLLDNFCVVGWDQRGTGGSYWGLEEESLTIERLTDDAAELIEYLCKQYNKKKIFIVGGSWGSLLGTWVAYRYPEKIAAYVGFGQFVNGAKNEELSWNFCIEEAKKANNQSDLDILYKVGPPEMGMYKGGYEGMLKQRNIMMKYGGYSKDEKKRNYSGGLIKPILLSGEYSVGDIIGLIIGHKVVLKKMWPEVGATDLETSCVEFKVPYYIFDGVLDRNTPSSLVQHYFDMIKSPDKELIWFKNSGHNPLGDEPERFKSLLKEKLLKIVKEEEL